MSADVSRGLECVPIFQIVQRDFQGLEYMSEIVNVVQETADPGLSLSRAVLNLP